MSKYTFSSPPPYRGVSRVLGALLGLSVLLNIILLLSRGDAPEDVDEATPEDPSDAVADVGEEGSENGAEATPDADADADPGEATPSTPAPIPADLTVGDFSSLEGIDVPLKSNLSVTIDSVVSGSRAAWVTATTGRIMVWWIDLSTDSRAGDRLRLLYEPGSADDVTIAVLRYQSQKMEKEFRAYFFKPEGDKYGSYWDESGREIPPRLKEPVMEDYEQITAVLGDGRDHKGYDFRAPTGTAVFSPRAAKVLRTTWNFKYNGNSLELRYADGTLARYLHLEGVADGLSAGSSVRAGQKVGTSGNTGRTNAPHLHYELEQAGRVVDPADYHGTINRTLSGDDLDAFRAQIVRLDEALSSILGG